MKLYVKIEDNATTFIKGSTAVVLSNVMPENGEIALASVSDPKLCSTTLLVRNFWYDGETIMLKSNNPEYPTLIFSGEDVSRVKILGRVVDTTSRLLPRIILARKAVKPK